VRRDRAEERLSRRILWLAVAVVVVAGALFLVATGRWRDVYAFVVQFHQQSLWATLLIVSVPVLLIVFLRAPDASVISSVASSGAREMHTARRC